MKIVVLNGSPKGLVSVTMQYVDAAIEQNLLGAHLQHKIWPLCAGCHGFVEDRNPKKTTPWYACATPGRRPRDLNHMVLSRKFCC